MTTVKRKEKENVIGQEGILALPLEDSGNRAFFGKVGKQNVCPLG
jgi:hypothetical protein